MTTTPKPPLGKPLSTREVQILSLVADGLSNPQISRRLFLAETTTKTHLARIAAKLGNGDRAAMVAIAFRKGWLK